MPTETSQPSVGDIITALVQDNRDLDDNNATSSSSVKCSLCMACLTPDDVPSTGVNAQEGSSSSLSSTPFHMEVHGRETGRQGSWDRSVNTLVGSDEQDLDLTRTLSLEEESLLCGRCHDLRRVSISRAAVSEEQSSGRAGEFRTNGEGPLVDEVRVREPIPLLSRDGGDSPERLGVPLASAERVDTQPRERSETSPIGSDDVEGYEAIDFLPDGILLSPRRARNGPSSPSRTGTEGNGVMMGLGLQIGDEVSAYEALSQGEGSNRGNSQDPSSHGSGRPGSSTRDHLLASEAESYLNHGPSKESHPNPPSPHSFIKHLRSPSPERAPNPYLDFGNTRNPSRGRGTLFPGSLFRGTQTSGRSSYDVEVRIVDVSFPDSTVSGYLSICHLTDTHPLLTTFFTGEIIGPKFGFLTGTSYYARATEQDDMRHWSRFEHFRKVKNELQRPGLTVREPRDTVESKGWERPFAFMRWKERFLVPDHRVRDISGASFAGFYYLQIDFDPPATYTPPRTTTTVSTISGRPTTSRRSSSSQSRPNHPTSIALASPDQADFGILALPPASPPRSPALPDSSGGRTATSPAPTLRRQSTADNNHAGGRARSTTKKAVKSQTLAGPPVLTGYYFHHQNSEPFQELCLHHVPQRGSGSFELR